jgi:hypothetical protein
MAEFDTSYPDETAENRIARLEYQVEELAFRIAQLLEGVWGDEAAAQTSMDAEISLVWEENMIDAGTPDESMGGCWEVRDAWPAKRVSV